VEPALKKAIEDAYEAFAGYHRPRHIDASPAKNPNIVEGLLSAPLHQLTEDQLRAYAGSALFTIGSLSDYKYFLPRILELAADSNGAVTDPPALARKLNYAEWRTWPSSQQSAVATVFRAALLSSSETHPDHKGSDASQWLCGLALLGEDAEYALREWMERLRGNALLQWAALIEHDLAYLASRTKGGDWEDVASEVRARLAAMLCSAQSRAALSGFEGVADDDLWRIEDAENMLVGHADTGVI
jgi:hypothetical protein